MNEKRWEYKDCNRCWWEIILELGEEKIPDTIDPNNEHWTWNYTVKRDSEHIYSATIVGQYNDMPTMQDILLDLSTYFTSVLLGMAKYCED